MDENTPPQCAKALKELGEPVTHVVHEPDLGAGTKDVPLFKALAHKGWFLLTQDKKIRRRPQERMAMIQHGIGAYILMGQADKSPTEFALLVLKIMEELKADAARRPRPFVVGISDHGKFETLA